MKQYRAQMCIVNIDLYDIIFLNLWAKKIFD